jgi:YD repeat-containing protein
LKYDDRGNVAKVTYDDGTFETWTYDATFGRVTSHTDPLGNTTKYAVDPATGRVLSETRVVGLDDLTSGETDDVVTRYTFDEHGNMLTLTEPAGNTTTWTYGGFGRVATESIVVDGVTLTRGFEYDARGNLVRRVTGPRCGPAIGRCGLRIGVAGRLLARRDFSGSNGIDARQALWNNEPTDGGLGALGRNRSGKGLMPRNGGDATAQGPVVTDRCEDRWTTPGGIPVALRWRPAMEGGVARDAEGLRLHLELARLKLLRGFDELLCLEGLTGVEHLPHQIETVRKVLRHFRGRVLLADEVGLGKTIEACLLLREYLLRGLVKRVLILTPSPLVSQWQEELRSKFSLEFSIPPRTPQADGGEYWARTDRVLASLSFVKSKRRAEVVAAAPWDLVIVDEAHHCKNRATKNWQLINALKRRHLFLLTATPVQNNLLELYNLLTLLEPGHLKTETDFKRQYVRRGNPRDPRNRERLRSLLGDVMIRNTRGLVEMDLPPRYAQTLMAAPHGDEEQACRLLNDYLRARSAPHGADCRPAPDAADGPSDPRAGLPPLTRRQLCTLLLASGSHPSALAQSLENIAGSDERTRAIINTARRVERSAKDAKLLELLAQGGREKMLIFANFRRTLEHIQRLLDGAGRRYVTFSGAESAQQKDAAVEAFRGDVPVMLCSESGGEGHNLQFANTLVNFDLPWNPMKIEQRVGRIHRIGQTREVFIFNLCTAGSLEARLLDLLSEKIRMFELVVGEVGSILGNLEEGEEFESLVLDLWLRSHDDRELEQSFDRLGESLLDAQEQYLKTKELDEALFGEDYE